MSDITTLAAITIEKLTATFEPGHVNEKELSVLSDVFDTIKGLVEALEKAQQHIGRQEQILINQNESLALRRDELEAAERRIAELEAREVKLPERYEVDMCPTPSPNGEWYSREDILAALVSAGVRYAAGIGKGEAS